MFTCYLLYLLYVNSCLNLLFLRNFERNIEDKIHTSTEITNKSPELWRSDLWAIQLASTEKQIRK